MTIDEFTKSLSADQNTALLAFRDSINAQRDTAHQELVTAKAGEISSLSAALKSAQDKAASEIKAKSDELATVQTALDSLKKDAASFLQGLSAVDHPDVQAAVQSATVELNKDETQKKRDALAAAIAANQAELAKLG